MIKKVQGDVFDRYVNLLFEIFGLTGWDRYSGERPVKTRNYLFKNHGLRSKSRGEKLKLHWFYKDWDKEKIHRE